MSAPVGRGPGADAAATRSAPSGVRGHLPRGARAGAPVLLLAREEDRARPAGAEPSVPGRAWESLTPRELQVVGLVTLGATNQQAARRLRVSPHTVNAHLRHVFTKLGVSSRVQLTRIAVAREQSGPRRVVG